jgi:HK97 family phage major capsid protein
MTQIEQRPDGSFVVTVKHPDGGISNNIFRSRATAQSFIDQLLETDRVVSERSIEKLGKPPTRRNEDRQPPAPPTRAMGAPYVIKDMTERQVYDLSTVSHSVYGSPRNAIIQRAERAIDLAHISARGKEAASELLHRGTSEDFSSDLVARRILTTGQPAYRSFFAKLVRSAVTGLCVPTPQEHAAIETVLEVQRAMSVGTGSAGGFAVPFTLDPTLTPTSAGSCNPYRAVCRVEQTTYNEWRGVASGGLTLAYGSEGSVTSDNSLTLAQPTVPIFAADGFIPISIELFGDFDAIQDQLSAEFQRAKDDLETTKFTLGTGTAEPFGLVVGATGTVNAGTAAIAPANLYAAEQALSPRFRPGAQWFANKIIYNDILQDAATNAGAATIWYPSNRPDGQRGNTGYDLITYPANEVSAMTSALTVGSKVAIIGDPKYFVIVDRIGLDVEVVRNLYQQTTMGAGFGFPTGQRGLYVLIRNGSKVVDPAAFKVLVTT